jgi:hypothetical protein
VVAPGFLVLFQFKPNLVISLDTVKLLVFSYALSLPVFFCKIVMMFFFSHKDIKEDLACASAMANTVFVQYPALILAYFGGLSFKGYLIALSMCQIWILLSEWWSSWKKKRTLQRTCLAQAFQSTSAPASWKQLLSIAIEIRALNTIDAAANIEKTVIALRLYDPRSAFSQNLWLGL